MYALVGNFETLPRNVFCSSSKPPNHTDTTHFLSLVARRRTDAPELHPVHEELTCQKRLGKFGEVQCDLKNSRCSEGMKRDKFEGAIHRTSDATVIGSVPSQVRSSAGSVKIKSQST